MKLFFISFLIFILFQQYVDTFHIKRELILGNGGRLNHDFDEFDETEDYTNWFVNWLDEIYEKFSLIAKLRINKMKEHRYLRVLVAPINSRKNYYIG